MTECHDYTVEADLKPSAASFYGWRVVWIGAFILVIGSYEQGLPQLMLFTLGEVLVPRGGSLALAVAYGVLTGLLPLLLMPLVGWAVDRWGARRLVLWGLLVLGVGAILYLGRQIPVVLYVSLFFVGVGGIVGTHLPAAAAVNNWFVSRRAMAMAVLLLPLVMVGFLFEVLGSSVEIDPRTASLTVAATVLVLAGPLSRLIRDRPEDHNQHPDGIAPGHRREPESDAKGCGDAWVPNYAWREALRTRAFWLLVVGGAVFSVSSGGLFFNALMMRQLGFEPVISGGASWIDGAFAILFVLVGGWVGDHFPIRRTMFVFGLLEACAAGVLAFAETLPMFYLSAALAGMGAGGMLPLTLASRGVYFGRRNFATITGLSLMLLNLISGGALAGILIAWLERNHRCLHVAPGNHSGNRRSRFVSIPVPGRSKARAVPKLTFGDATSFASGLSDWSAPHRRCPVRVGGFRRRHEWKPVDTHYSSHCDAIPLCGGNPHIASVRMATLRSIPACAGSTGDMTPSTRIQSRVWAREFFSTFAAERSRRRTHVSTLWQLVSTKHTACLLDGKPVRPRRLKTGGVGWLIAWKTTQSFPLPVSTSVRDPAPMV